MSRNVDIIVEQISANDVSAIVVEVYLVDGSAVREGDRILAVETSKAVYEVFAPANGIFVHSLKVGDTVANLERRSEEHTSELQSHLNLVCRLLLEKKKKNKKYYNSI